MDLIHLSIGVILKYRNLRTKLFTGNYPEELKRKVAVVYIETWLIKKALSRFTTLPFQYDNVERAKFHGFVYYPHISKFIAFFWFGKKHGYMQTDNGLDSDEYAWYHLDQIHGPWLSQANRHGTQIYRYYEKGNLMEDKTRTLYWGDEYDQHVGEIKNHNADSELCNMIADIGVHLSFEYLNNF